MPKVQVDATVASRAGVSPTADGSRMTGRATPRAWMPRAVAAGEVLVSVAAAVVSVALSRFVAVNPLDRIGQVSGLAALGLRYAVLGLAVLGVAALGVRWARPGAAEAVRALACAAMAGLVTGLIAGGLVVALRGTTWPLFANSGDAGQLGAWAADVLAGGSPPADYPPLPVYAMAWWSQLTGAVPGAALKVLQVGGAGLFGPIAYAAWRLLLRPGWALVMVLVAALPLMDLYKPYSNVVLVALLPVLVRLLAVLRRSGQLSYRRLTLTGAGYGLVLGVLFLGYSGWFVWSALGVAAVAIAVFPWRTSPGRGAVLVVATSVVFVAVTARHLFGILFAAGSVSDRFFYFDTYTEPAYIAMWRNDTPGDVGPWPPPGEFAGMGVFSALLVLGLGLALALGRRRVDVLTLAACMGGAWLVRLYVASRMYADQAVQLYPRTTAEILFCLLALSTLATMLLGRRVAAALRSRAIPSVSAAISPDAVAGRTVALLAAALLAGLFMGSATADRYMPRNDRSAGYLAFASHHVRQVDGRCGAYVDPLECADRVQDIEGVLRPRNAPN